MHFAASAVAFNDSAWHERLDELAGAGCEFLELTAAFGPSSREGAAFDYMDPFAVERVGRAIERSGLRLHSMHGPMLLLPPSRRSPFGAAGLSGLLEAERAACDAVMALGGRFVVTQDIAELEPEKAPHLAARGPLAELADYAAERGIVFCIENGAESSDAFGRLAGVVHELKHPGLGICLDTGHAQVWNYCDVPRAVAACGAAIRSCHVHDNLGSSDAHLVPGNGIVPWAAVVRGLADVAYRGPLVVEMYSDRRRAEPASEVRATREFMESVGADCLEPVAALKGFEVFAANDADRERAALVMGGDVVPAGPEDDAVSAAIATDRFGDPAAWGSLAPGKQDGDDAGTMTLAISFRRGEDAEVARAMAEVLVEAGSSGELRAEDAAAEALGRMGYERDSGGRFVRPGPAGKAAS